MNLLIVFGMVVDTVIWGGGHPRNTVLTPSAGRNPSVLTPFLRRTHPRFTGRLRRYADAPTSSYYCPTRDWSYGGKYVEPMVSTGTQTLSKN